MNWMKWWNTCPRDHRVELRRGNFNEGPGGFLYCPFCEKHIGSFRQ